MAKRRNDACPVATPATPATRGGRRWIDEGGDELTRRGRWEDERVEFGNIMDAGFWCDIEKQAEECDRILQKNGLPMAGQSVRYDNKGKWWDRDDPSAPAFELNSGAGGGIGLGFAFAQKQSEPFSDPWYAAYIGGEIWMILKDKDASHEWQLRRVLNIGILSAEWHWRRRYKPSILTGRKQRKVLSAHRGNANSARKASAAERRAAISRMMQQTRQKGGALGNYLRRRLKEEAGIDASLRTIRRDVSAILGDQKKVGQTG